MSLTPQQAALAAVQISLDRDLGYHHEPEVINLLDEPVVETSIVLPQQRVSEMSGHAYAPSEQWRTG